jgi:hypothetical protein
MKEKKSGEFFPFMEIQNYGATINRMDTFNNFEKLNQ